MAVKQTYYHLTICDIQEDVRTFDPITCVLLCYPRLCIIWLTVASQKTFLTFDLLCQPRILYTIYLLWNPGRLYINWLTVPTKTLYHLTYCGSQDFISFDLLWQPRRLYTIWPTLASKKTYHLTYCGSQDFISFHLLLHQKATLYDQQHFLTIAIIVHYLTNIFFTYCCSCEVFCLTNNKKKFEFLWHL